MDLSKYGHILVSSFILFLAIFVFVTILLKMKVRLLIKIPIAIFAFLLLLSIGAVYELYPTLEKVGYELEENQEIIIK
ncbi:hypothetical protein P9Z80_13785 [Bacillus cereus]|nr:hypothetical protein [Bacillus cereus]MEC3260922.1 hypothetical protein [Bacillus cereus]